jgi:shikimate dehydrogenase
MNPVRICLSLFGTTETICAAIDNSVQADLYEIRMDLSEPLDFQAIRNATAKPLIYTAHGRADLLRDTEPFADYVDAGAHPPTSAKSIVSVHAGESDPNKLWTELSGEHITKIVLNTQRYGTIAKLLELNRKHAPDALCFAEGDVGAFSRIRSVFMGAPWIYSCLPSGATGAGQFTLQQLSELYRLKRFDQSPQIFGIVGYPVSHSKSPEFHNRKFAEHSLPWIYLPFLCEDLESLMQHASLFGINGFSITHPFKTEVLQYLNESSDEVKQLHSCNTVCLKNEKWHGINTDVIGVRSMLQRHQIPIDDSRVVIIGAGASARALLSVVRSHAKEVTILNRAASTSGELAAEFQCKSGILRDFARCEYDVLFQTTPVGMKPGESPVDLNELKEGTTIIDILYEPTATALLQKAKELGCRAYNGAVWFEAQAEAQFDWWRSMLLQ